MTVVHWTFNEILACIHPPNLIHKLNCSFDYVFKGAVCHHLFHVKQSRLMPIGVLKAGKYSCQFNFKIHVEVHVLVFFNSLYEFKVIY